MALKINEYLRNPLHPITVTVIGCGGTGSLVISRLARLNYALQELEHPGIMVKAYDGDIVEKNNIGRQNFSIFDLGINKAICCIEKCNLTFGTYWEAVPDHCPPNLIYNSNITICCVDNIKFRQSVKLKIDSKGKRIDYLFPFFYIDCGNGKDFGQVILSDYYFEGLKKLNNVFDIYPNYSEMDNVETQGIQGCSYLDSLEKQDLFINDKIALECVELLKKLLTRSEIDYQGVICNLSGKSNPIKI